MTNEGVHLVPFSGPEMTVVVLDPVSPLGVKPDYCIHGKVSCVQCGDWCWLGDQTYQEVAHGRAAPLCRSCAKKLIPPGIQPSGHIDDRLRSEGPHPGDAGR